MELQFLLNGRPVVVRDPSPITTLADYLRSPGVGLTGTKVSCGEGGCGACTVMLASTEGPGPHLDRAINACLHPLCEMDGMAVTTIEGVGSASAGYNPVQERLVEHNGSQCGYCSPGFVMNMVALLRQNPDPTAQQVEDRFDGNLCRCTGFRPILNAMQSFVGDPVASREAAVVPPRASVPARADAASAYTANGYTWYRALDVPMLLVLLDLFGGPGMRVKLVHGNTSIGIYKRDVEDPKVLIDISRIQSLRVRKVAASGAAVELGGGVTLAEMLEFLDQVIATQPPARTEGLRAWRQHAHRIATEQVRSVASMAGNLMLVTAHAASAEPFASDLFLILATLGASVTVERPDASPTSYPMLELPGPEAFPRGFVITAITVPFTDNGAVVRTYKVARRTQNAHAIINCGFSVTLDAKHRVTWARIVYGGIAARPIALDTVAQWLVGQEWNQALLESLPLRIESTLLPQVIPMPVTGISQAYRLALAVNLSRRFWVALALARNPAVVPPDLSSAGSPFVRPVSSGREIFLDAPYHDSEAHLALADVATALPGRASSPADRATWAPDHKAAAAVARSRRDETPTAPIATVPIATLPIATVPTDSALPKVGAILQASGEARYTQDLAGPAQTVQAVYVLSARPNATFDFGTAGFAAVKAELLTQVSGTLAYVSFADIPKPSASDSYSDADPGNYDPVFANGRVTAVGQPIGVVVASDTRAAQDGALWVEARLRYTDVAPAVLTIAEALAVPGNKGILSGNGSTPVLTRPGSDTKWLDQPVPEAGKVFVQGAMRTGAQSHFYMEPQVTLAVPGEGKQMELFSSSQHLAACQEAVASHLGWAANAITARAIRLGGGFGGKEVRPPYLSSAAAVAAVVVNRPVRLALDRRTDMQLIGTRHPYLGAYSISADPTGRIEKIRIDHWSNAGFSYDASLPIMDLVVFSADGTYRVDTFRATGTVCRTNVQTRTAFRSFGVIQGMLILESAIEHLAHTLGVRAEDLREKNFYRDASSTSWDVTPYNQALKYCRINQVWRDWRTLTEFDTREPAVQAFNAANRWRKRGIAMIPLKYGISYTYRPMNQGGAYVITMSADGTVILHHGGIEMGQGIHTKMIAIAAQTLGIDYGLISVAESETSTIPNASSTGASTGSDLNGGAVKAACTILRERLTAFCLSQYEVKDFPDWVHEWAKSWPKVVALANTARIDLSAEALYDSPNLGELDPKTGQLPNGEQLFYYFNYCVAVSEVEIDVLTGESEVLRADLVYDAGRSLDSVLDFGQIEGGFIQGLGNVSTEEVYLGSDGRFIPDGTWNYKPPFSQTIPIDLRVALLQYVRNDHATDTPMDHYGIQSSKSTGEPPLVLANSVYFAIRHAVAAARADLGHTDWFELDSPATVERVQRAIVSTPAPYSP